MNEKDNVFRIVTGCLNSFTTYCKPFKNNLIQSFKSLKLKVKICLRKISKFIVFSSKQIRIKSLTSEKPIILFEIERRQSISPPNIFGFSFHIFSFQVFHQSFYQTMVSSSIKIQNMSKAEKNF
jgi:hypothetical protein